MHRISVVILSVLMSCSVKLYATAQAGDLLIIDKDTVVIFSNPLETYFSEKGSRTFDGIEMKAFRSSLWRGYMATWQLENDSLFLVGIIDDGIISERKNISIKGEFGYDRVFANWVTDTLIRPEGVLLQYVHAGYASIFEKETHYIFNHGKLVEIENFDFVERDDALFFPGEQFLRDTIMSLVQKSMTATERDSLDPLVECVLKIEFDETGTIAHIALEYAPRNVTEEVILRSSQKALCHFPTLMKVNHKGYYPPYLEFWIRASCLKSPDNNEKGCE